MAHSIEAIDEGSSKEKTRSRWKAYLEHKEKAEENDQISAHLKEMAKKVGFFALAFIAFLIEILLALGIAFGISLAVAGTVSGSAAVTTIGALTAIASGAAFITLACTIHNIGKYNAKMMSENTLVHQLKRDWQSLNDKTIELDTLA